MEILIGVAAFIILLILIICIGYVKAPPDTAYMISGFRKPRILIGKAGIRIPFLERLDKLSLKMFSVDVKTTDFVPNAEYINVKVDATVKIRIGQSEEMMSLASKFFLNESEDMPPSSRSGWCTAKSTTMPRLTKFSNKNCLARAMFSSRENSFCKAMSKLYASWAFFPRSAFSTAFHSVWRSAYSGGAWDGRRMSEQITPPLRV